MTLDQVAVPENEPAGVVYRRSAAPLPQRGGDGCEFGLDTLVAPNFQAMPEFRTIMAALRTAGLQA